MSKKNVLVIGDTHEPFCHPQYKSFCYEVANKFQCSEVVHIGDEVDNHAISYHESKPDGHGAGREADLAQDAMYKWYKSCLLYTSPSPRDRQKSRMPSSA